MGLASGDPGTSATPANEASGGSYARKATAFGAGAASASTGSAVTLDSDAATYTYVRRQNGRQNVADLNYHVAITRRSCRPTDTTTSPSRTIPLGVRTAALEVVVRAPDADVTPARGG
ncbi:hypothetical protein [Mycobacterium sp.]|uniref:hypothetical protein n=1 Tax=Mycobacterium sp. TaxID=1785 RepID=UPI003C7716B4